MTQLEDAKCFFCEALLDDDHFCYGCHAYVCETCDPRVEDAPMGAHSPMEHLAVAEEVA